MHLLRYEKQNRFGQVEKEKRKPKRNKWSAYLISVSDFVVLGIKNGLYRSWGGLWRRGGAEKDSRLGGTGETRAGTGFTEFPLYIRLLGKRGFNLLLVG